MKPAQDLQSKWETCCSPDDFNKVIHKTPSSSLAWLEFRSRCPTCCPQLVFYHSCTTNHLLPQFRARFSSCRQKEHHMSKPWSPFRWGRWVLALDCVQLSPTHKDGPSTAHLFNLFNVPPPNTGQWECLRTVHTISPDDKLAHRRVSPYCQHQGGAPSAWWHPAPCCNPWP